MDLGNTGDGNDGANGGFLHIHLLQAVELIQTADLDFMLLVRIMMIQKRQLLVDGDGAVLHLADADPAYVFIVIDGADQDLGILIRIAFRRGDIFQDRLKQRLHILRGVGKIQHRMAGLGGRV